MLQYAKLVYHLLMLSNFILHGYSACEENIKSYAEKAIVNNEVGNILSNTTVKSQDECRDVCCSTLPCKMAVFSGNLTEENCVLYHCTLTCEEVENNSTVLLVKKVKGGFCLPQLMFLYTRFSFYCVMHSCKYLA